MTEAASITPTTTHEEILSRLPPNIRHMAARNPFVSAMFSPVFLRAVKEILTEGNNDEESSH